jgi:hypothetical protein
MTADSDGWGDKESVGSGIPGSWKTIDKGAVGKIELEEVVGVTAWDDASSTDVACAWSNDKVDSTAMTIASSSAGPSRAARLSSFNDVSPERELERLDAVFPVDRSGRKSLNNLEPSVSLTLSRKDNAYEPVLVAVVKLARRRTMRTVVEASIGMNDRLFWVRAILAKSGRESWA